MSDLLTTSIASWVELDDQFVLCTVRLQCVLVRPTHNHNLSFSTVPDGLVPVFPVQMKGQIPGIPASRPDMSRLAVSGDIITGVRQGLL
jgi:hypothetical protein